MEPGFHFAGTAVTLQHDLPPQDGSCLPSCPGSLENGPFSLHPANNYALAQASSFLEFSASCRECVGYILLLWAHHVHTHFCHCIQFLRGSLGQGGCV